MISSTYTSFTHCIYVDSKKMQYKTLKVYLSKLTFLYLNSVFFLNKLFIIWKKGKIDVYSLLFT